MGFALGRLDSGNVTSEQLPAVIEDIVNRAAQKRAIDIAAGDSVIALSTCEDATTFERVVLFGKLVPMTDAEMRAAEAANYAKSQAEKEQGGATDAPSFLDRHPWAIPVGGAFVLLLLAYLAYRFYVRSRRH